MGASYIYCETCHKALFNPPGNRTQCNECIASNAFELLHTITVDDFKGLSKGYSYTYYYNKVCVPRINALLAYEPDSDQWQQAAFILQRTCNEAFKAYIWPKRGNSKGAKPASERALIRAAEALALTKKITSDAIDLRELELRANKVIEALINAKNKQQPLVMLDAVQWQHVEELSAHITTVLSDLETSGCVTVGSTEVLLRMLSLSLP